MTQLYPIGTQLITRRLSQAALAYEFGFWVETQDSTGEWCNSFHVDANVIEIVGEDTDVCVAEFASTWRVTVTAENQKWLSPVPMVGDLVTFTEKERCFAGEVVQVQESTVTLVVPERINGKDYYIIPKNLSVVEKRTYPNNQRAPLIAFDEVLLPTKGEQS